MKADNQLKFPSVILGIIVGAVAALFLAPAPGEATRRYLRERCDTGLGYMNSRASKLRETARAWVKTGKKFTGYKYPPVGAVPEAGSQAYEEKKRETLGG